MAIVKLTQPYRCRRRRYLSAFLPASLYDLPFTQRSADDSYDGRAWNVPFSNNYNAALQTGREYAAHFAQYLKDMPPGQPDNELGLTICSMCLDEKTCAGGFHTGQTFERYIAEFGTKVTLRELIGASMRLEIYYTIVMMLASLYVGAVIGSIAVALARMAGKSATRADVMTVAARARIKGDWLRLTLVKHPEIYQCNIACRSEYYLCGR